jgi:hypothetical protein
MLPTNPARQTAAANEKIWRRVESERNIVQMVMERKLNFFGHIGRMNNTRLAQ